MQALRSIKLLISITFSLAFLAFVLIGGVGGAYLDHNPDKAAAYAFGTMNVDPEASYLDQAVQLIEGYKGADKALSGLEGLESEASAAAADAADEAFSRSSHELAEERFGPLGETSGDEPMDSASGSDASFE